MQMSEALNPYASQQAGSGDAHENVLKHSGVSKLQWCSRPLNEPKENMAEIGIVMEIRQQIKLTEIKSFDSLHSKCQTVSLIFLRRRHARLIIQPY
jgi:hypothetical protein